MTTPSAAAPGHLRRLIDLRRERADTYVGWVEDDFHHFGVTLVVQDDRVADVRVAAPRTPWATCTSAGDPLRALIGQPLLARASDIGTLIDMRLQCTHVFDLTGLVMAHAAQRRDHRRYEARIDDRVRHGEPRAGHARFGKGTATLRQDGITVLQWHLEGDAITAPAHAAGRSLNDGFRAWTEGMDLDEAEQAFVLRRAIMVGGGRTLDLDRIERAADMNFRPVCHTYQPAQSVVAWRMKGATRDYSGDASGMLAHLHRVP